jgi:signal transduction histidine kinase
VTGRDKKPRARANELNARVTRKPPRRSGAYSKVEAPKPAPATLRAPAAVLTAPAALPSPPPPSPLGLVNDLRNLVYVISACAEAATRDVEPGSDAYENLTDIRAAAVRATKLLDTLAPAHPSDVGPLDVNATIADFLAILRRQAGSRARVVLDAAPGELRVAVDSHSLEHVLLNLVVNAVDAMPEVGVVTVRTEAEAGLVRITVVDTGSGMDEATLARAFDVRFTTRAAIGRRGMGLATVRRLIDGMGGTVWARSALGVGTEIVIEVPVRQAPPSAPLRP